MPCHRSSESAGDPRWDAGERSTPLARWRQDLPCNRLDRADRQGAGGQSCLTRHGLRWNETCVLNWTFSAFCGVLIYTHRYSMVLT